MECTVQDVLQRYFESYRASHALPAYAIQSAYRLMACRTAELGGHKQLCPNGHVEGIWYNSCKHRACPQCRGLPAERWLQRQRGRLLRCAHYHMIFTIPHDYIPLWLYNRSRVMSLLFTSARDALFTFTNDPRYLGATPGVLACFHSWGRDLAVHPHLHVLVTAGGLDARGEWVKPKRSHLVPTKPLMQVFQGKFNAGLREQLSDLALPPDRSERYWHNQINRLGKHAKQWNVNIRERYDTGDGVVKYLARYVRGGPFHNRQLLGMGEGQVRFRYYDHRLNPDGQRRNASVIHFSQAEFIRRCLMHVPEPGRHTVRQFGLYACRQGERLNRARHCHHQPEVSKAFTPIGWQAYVARFGAQSARQSCRVCQQPILTIKLKRCRASEPP